jgi:hypothetical protein
MGRDELHSYVVVTVKGGSPSREQVGEEILKDVETGGCSCWCCVAADCSWLVSIMTCGTRSFADDD